MKRYSSDIRAIFALLVAVHGVGACVEEELEGGVVREEGVWWFGRFGGGVEEEVVVEEVEWCFS